MVIMAMKHVDHKTDPTTEEEEEKTDLIFVVSNL